MRLSVTLFYALVTPLNCPLWVRFTLSLRLIFQIELDFGEFPFKSSHLVTMIGYD